MAVIEHETVAYTCGIVVAVETFVVDQASFYVVVHVVVWELAVVLAVVERIEIQAPVVELAE